MSRSKNKLRLTKQLEITLFPNNCLHRNLKPIWHQLSSNVTDSQCRKHAAILFFILNCKTSRVFRAVVSNRGFPNPWGSKTRFSGSEIRFSWARVCMLFLHELFSK